MSHTDHCLWWTGGAHFHVTVGVHSAKHNCTCNGNAIRPSIYSTCVVLETTSSNVHLLLGLLFIFCDNSQASIRFSTDKHVKLISDRYEL